MFDEELKKLIVNVVGLFSYKFEKTEFLDLVSLVVPRLWKERVSWKIFISLLVLNLNPIIVESKNSR
jgi:hypothetical protein